jgi:hypothetical protein
MVVIVGRSCRLTCKKHGYHDQRMPNRCDHEWISSGIIGTLSCPRTYSQNRRIIRHLGTCWRLGRGRLTHMQVLHIRASKDNVLEDVVIGRDLLGGVATTTFCTVRLD